jgi:hypothetical protein
VGPRNVRDKARMICGWVGEDVSSLLPGLACISGWKVDPCAELDENTAWREWFQGHVSVKCL